MNVQSLIYGYMAVCCLMIFFNIATIFINKLKRRRHMRKNRKFTSAMEEQFSRIRVGGEVEEDHLKWLEKQLRRVWKLLSFDSTVELFWQDGEIHGVVLRYLDSLYPVFEKLCGVYLKRESEELTYFTYIIRKYRIAENHPRGRIADLMLKLASQTNLYCQENALYILYQMGEPKPVIKALLNVYYHSDKLIYDGLLTYSGDRAVLCGEIWDNFNRFTTPMKVTLLSYLRLSGSECCERVLDELAKPNQDDEVRFACMRYFSRFAYEPAYPFLLRYLLRDGESRENRDRWEYAAIAARALSAYPSERTKQALISALHSSNWYVRTNAAQTLVDFGMRWEDFVEIFEGNDRYAREILEYWLDCRDARENQSKLGEEYSLPDKAETTAVSDENREGVPAQI